MAFGIFREVLQAHPSTIQHFEGLEGSKCRTVPKFPIHSTGSISTLLMKMYLAHLTGMGLACVYVYIYISLFIYSVYFDTCTRIHTCIYICSYTHIRICFSKSVFGVALRICKAKVGSTFFAHTMAGCRLSSRTDV